MRPRKFFLLPLIFFPAFLLSSRVWSQTAVSDPVGAALDTMEQPASTWSQGDYAAVESQFLAHLRQEEMETTLHKVEVQVSLELFMVTGEQKFEYQPGDGTASRLVYKHEGNIPVVKAEVGYDRFAIGGRYASSELRKVTNTDEDWNILMDVNGVPTPVDYTISYQDAKTQVESYDANLYYTLLDKDFLAGELPRWLSLESYSLDVFAGYQYYRGRYAMCDPAHERLLEIGGTWYYDASLPADIGLDSPYKITYRGPRAGLRLTGKSGKISVQTDAALAYLTTTAHGYWNLRDYNFWQHGRNGYGLDWQLDVTYELTPHWSAGLGYEFSGLYQPRLAESGIMADPANPGTWLTYDDEDTIKNAYSTTSGLVLILKYSW